MSPGTWVNPFRQAPTTGEHPSRSSAGIVPAIDDPPGRSVGAGLLRRHPILRMCADTWRWFHLSHTRSHSSGIPRLSSEHDLAAEGVTDALCQRKRPSSAFADALRNCSMPSASDSDGSSSRREVPAGCRAAENEVHTSRIASSSRCPGFCSRRGSTTSVGDRRQQCPGRRHRGSTMCKRCRGSPRLLHHSHRRLRPRPECQGRRDGVDLVADPGHAVLPEAGR